MPSRRLRRFDCAIVIDGEEFVTKHWRATLANGGAMGDAVVTGVLSDLAASGVDVVALSQTENGAPFDIYAGYDDDIQHIFSGVVEGLDFDWDEDCFEIKGHDHAIVLNDGKQTVAGLNYRNQSVAQIVQQIADKFGLQTDITDSGIMAGPQMNNEHSFNPHPQTYWHLLNELAENVGYECYITPDQVLYFGPEKSNGNININYGAERGSDAENPGWGLKMSYEPRNNSNITVKTISYTPQDAQKVTASATADQIKVKKGRKSRGNLTTAPKVLSSKKPSAGPRPSAKSVYYIRCAGMTPEQAKARCQAVADDLAKHQVIMTVSIEGNLDVKLHTKAKLIETNIDLYGFGGINLNCAEITHSFDMVDGLSSSGGFVTTIRGIGQVNG